MPNNADFALNHCPRPGFWWPHDYDKISYERLPTWYNRKLGCDSSGAKRVVGVIYNYWLCGGGGGGGLYITGGGGGGGITLSCLGVGGCGCDIYLWAVCCGFYDFFPLIYWPMTWHFITLYPFVASHVNSAKQVPSYLTFWANLLEKY